MSNLCSLCSRATRNASFFAEVEHAFTLLSKCRVSIGGNAPVMAQRFVSEGVGQVMLGANMSPDLRSELDSRIQGYCCHEFLSVFLHISYLHTYGVGASLQR